MCLFGFSTAFAQETDRTVYAEGALTIPGVSAHLDYFLDSTWNETITDVIGPSADKFEPIKTSEPNFGYIDDKIWLRLSVKNITSKTEQWRLFTQENFFQYYDVYVLRENGAVEHIESHDLDSPFSARTIPYPDLVSPIKISPQECVTIYVSYYSGGSSNAAISLETADSFATKALTHSSKNYISYGMMMILVFSSAIALIVLRMKVFVAYLAYVLVASLYLMHGDGVTFQYIWPTHPRFNAYFMIIIGTAFVVTISNFAQVFLQTDKYHPTIDKIIKGLILLTILIVIPLTFIDPQLTKKTIIILAFIAIITGIIAGIIAAMTRFREVRFYLFAWTCGFLSVGLLNIRHVLGFDFAQDVEFDIFRVTIVVDAIMMGLGVADRYTQVLKSRQSATEQSLVEAKRNLKLNARLQSLEEQYQLAVEMAASRDKNLKDTVHDLQQPLHALRLSLKSSKEGKSARRGQGQGQEQAKDKDTNIDQAFSYLETLIANHLQQSVDGSEALESIETSSLRDERELDLPKVVQSIYEMFAQDALEKGLEFKFVKTTQQANVEPLVLMRIVTNILANAIKYTPSGKILLGTRRTKDSLRIEVHDTGLGLTEAEFARAKIRHTRLHENQIKVDGQGYGLSIASELAQKHGLKLSRMPHRQNGTSISLEIPK